MREVRTLLLLVAATALVMTSCAPPPVRDLSGPSPKFLRYAFKEEGNLVNFIVDTHAAIYREDANFFPLEVAIANKGRETLEIDMESFTLEDRDGHAWAPAGYNTLLREYPEFRADDRLFELTPHVGLQFDAYTRVASAFFPMVSDRARIERVSLPRFTYIVDVLYFPTPEDGFEGKIFDLYLDAKGLPEPVFVTFEIRR